MTEPAQAHDRTLAQFQAYLALLVRVKVHPRLRGKLDLSGVVQQTLLEAIPELSRLAACPEPQRCAWLRRALANNLADAIRKLRAEGRDAFREQSLEDALDRSSARLEGLLADEQTSPSGRAAGNERALRLAKALESLAEDEREAIVLQHWHGWTLRQIGEHLGRTSGAVAGLIHRGLKKLRGLLDGLEDS